MENDNAFFVDDAMLNEYLDGTLDEATRARLEMHITNDASIAQRLNALRSTIDQLNVFGDQTWPLTVDLGPRVLDALQSQAQSTRSAIQPTLRWIVVAQLVFGVALLAVLLPMVISDTLPTLKTQLTQIVSQWDGTGISFDMLRPPEITDWLSIWAQISTVLSGSWAQSLQTVSYIGICGGAMTLLWILSNGMLLRRTPWAAISRERND